MHVAHDIEVLRCNTQDQAIHLQAVLAKLFHTECANVTTLVFAVTLASKANLSSVLECNKMISTQCQKHEGMPAVMTSFCEPVLVVSQLLCCILSSHGRCKPSHSPS